MLLDLPLKRVAELSYPFFWLKIWPNFKKIVLSYEIGPNMVLWPNLYKMAGTTGLQTAYIVFANSDDGNFYFYFLKELYVTEVFLAFC